MNTIKPEILTRISDSTKQRLRDRKVILKDKIDQLSETEKQLEKDIETEKNTKRLFGKKKYEDELKKREDDLKVRKALLKEEITTYKEDNRKYKENKRHYEIASGQTPYLAEDIVMGKDSCIVTYRKKKLKPGTGENDVKPEYLDEYEDKIYRDSFSFEVYVADDPKLPEAFIIFYADRIVGRSTFEFEDLESAASTLYLSDTY